MYGRTVPCRCECPLCLLPHNFVHRVRDFPGLTIETLGTHDWYKNKRSKT